MHPVSKTETKWRFFPGCLYRFSRHPYLTILSRSKEVHPMHTDLPLFSWIPPTKLLAFPPVKQTGRIREVAVKMMDKSTQKHADHYRGQVTDALERQLVKADLPKTRRQAEIDLFWEAVNGEMLRLTYHGRGTGGAA
jgi:hypothetical protein